MKKINNALHGIGKNPEEKLIVQKSRPLIALAQSELSLCEFKILDAYLARINSHKPEERTVILSKGQLEQLLGVSRINKPDLEKRLRNLYQPIDLIKEDATKLKLVALFEEAEAEQDENGIWNIKLTCTNSAMKYIFNADGFGYIKYKLRSIVSLKSRYSLTLFLYLESNRFRKSWDVSLIELKEFLNCANDESYNEFKIFNQQILKKCKNELHDKTECRFNYEPIRKGRKVDSIHFELETIADIIQNTPVPEFEQLKEENYKNSNFDFLNGACEHSFTAEEIEVIFSIINTMQLPVHPEGIDFARYHYLAEKYAILKLEEKKQKIQNRFGYFKAMIIRDREAGGTGQIEGQMFLEDYPGVVPKKTVHSTSSAKKYNNYPQREHDSGFYEDLELKLQQKAWENIVDVEQNDMNDIKEEEPEEMNEMEMLYELIQKLSHEEFEKLMKEVR